MSVGVVRLVADLDATEAPVIAIPEAFANETAGRGRSVFHVNRAAVSRPAGGDRTADNRAANETTSDSRAEAALRACGGRCERTGDGCDRDDGSKCHLHVLGSPRDGAFSQRRV